MERRLVWSVDPGHRGDLTGTGTTVQAFGITCFALRQRRIQVDLEKREAGALVQLAYASAAIRVRRYDGDQRDGAGVGKQACHLADPTHVLFAIGRVETEVGAKTVPYVVAIQQVRAATGGDEQLLDMGRQRRFSRGGQPGEPDRRSRLAEGAPARSPANGGPLPDDVGARQCRDSVCDALISPPEPDGYRFNRTLVVRVR